MGGRGSSSKLASHGGGGVPGVAGGGSGGTGVDGSGRMGGSAGGNPMHAEPGPSGRDSKDQRGLQETNGMAGGKADARNTARDHIDGESLTRDQKIEMIMADNNCSRDQAEAIYQSFSSYSNGGDYDFLSSDDEANYMYGNRPDETKILSDALIKMPYYDGTIYRAIELDDSAVDNFIDYMQTNNVEAWGFSGYLRGDSDNFYFWEAGDLRDAGVVSSFTSSRYIALHDYGNVAEDKGSLKYFGRQVGTTTVLFQVEGNKTASSITHLSDWGLGEYEVLSPHLQQFSFDKVETTWANSPKGPHRIVTIHMTDKGIKPKDRGPVR